MTYKLHPQMITPHNLRRHRTETNLNYQYIKLKFSQHRLKYFVYINSFIPNATTILLLLLCFSDKKQADLTEVE